MRVRVFDPTGRVETDRLERDGAVRIDRMTDADDLVDADDRSVFVAVGSEALLEYVRRGGTGPMLPIGVDAGIPSVAERAATDALTALPDGHDTATYPTLDVTASEAQYRALSDVMVVTAEPARISEYRARKVETDTVIDQVRADGIVVAGPAGTPGYGTAAGGPIVDRDLRGVSVVPVSPFRTSRPRWVIAPPLQLEVIRESVPVSLLVDDREVGHVPAGDPLTLDWADPLEVVVVDQSVDGFGHSKGEA